VLGSRLKQSLRERLGYTYHVSSQFAARNGNGPFVVAAAVGNDNAGAAVRAVVHELKTLQQEPVSGVELADAQNLMRGGFLRSFQSAYEIAIRLKYLAMNNLPADYYQRHLQEISDLTADDLLAVARRHISPRRLSVAAVGRVAELRTQFFDCGQVFEINP
jgi:zinc protease